MKSCNRILVRLLLATLTCGGAGLAQAQAQQPNQAQLDAIRQNCRSDYQSNCAGVPAGTQASLQCLQQHQAELSPPCKRAVAALQGGGAAHPAATATQAPRPAMSPTQEMALMRRACGTDYRTWCRGVPLGGGHAVACLAANRSHVSSGCRTALAEMKAMR